MNEPAVPARYHQAAQFGLNSGGAAAFCGTGWLWKTTADNSMA
jgi:hypothetical protein